MPRAELTLFAHIASRPEAEIDLAQTALLVAEDEYPGLDVAAYIERIDGYGAATREVLLALDKPGDRRSTARLERALDFVYRELGFAGNASDYYDPRNSWLNDVLDRKVGIPITLAVVLLEIFARAGVEAAGVSFPGHFLVRSPGPYGAALRRSFRRENPHARGAARAPRPRRRRPERPRSAPARACGQETGARAYAAQPPRHFRRTWRPYSPARRARAPGDPHAQRRFKARNNEPRWRVPLATVQATNTQLRADCETRTTTFGDSDLHA